MNAHLCVSVYGWLPKMLHAQTLQVINHGNGLNIHAQLRGEREDNNYRQIRSNICNQSWATSIQGTQGLTEH